MDRRKFGLVALLVVTIAVPTLIVGNGMILSSSLDWGIEIGDEFRYHVLEAGWELTGGGVTSNRTFFDAINDTVIIATVTALPDIGFYLTGGDFTTGVIEFGKMSVVFENGSSLPSDYWMVERTLSRCILPIGGWSLIDGFYQDTPTLDGRWDVYYAYQLETLFIFGYHKYDIDLDVSYEAHVSHNTGLPITAYYHRVHGVDYDRTIILEQLDT